MPCLTAAINFTPSTYVIRIIENPAMVGMLHRPPEDAMGSSGMAPTGLIGQVTGPR
jgi:hypothetical protein